MVVVEVSTSLLSQEVSDKRLFDFRTSLSRPRRRAHGFSLHGSALSISWLREGRKVLLEGETELLPFDKFEFCVARLGFSGASRVPSVGSVEWRDMRGGRAAVENDFDE